MTRVLRLIRHDCHEWNVGRVTVIIPGDSIVNRDMLRHAITSLNLNLLEHV